MKFVSGHYTLLSGSQTTEFTDTLGPSCNRITDKGLDAMALGIKDVYFHLGRSTEPYSPTQSSLREPAVLSTGVSSKATVTKDQHNGIWRTRYTATFSPGQLRGEFTEIGFNELIGGVTQAMQSIAKIRDQEGNLSYTEVLNDEPLTVIYDAFSVAATTDVQGVLQYKGEPVGFRLLAFDPDSSDWSLDSGNYLKVANLVRDTGEVDDFNYPVKKTPYVNGTYEQGIYLTIPTGNYEEFNEIQFSGGGRYRLIFDRTLTKDSNEEIVLGTLDVPFIYTSWGKV